MLGLDPGRCGQIRDRASYLQNSIISPGAQVKINHRFLQQFDTLRIQHAILSQLSRCHARITGHFALAAESFELKEWARVTRSRIVAESSSAAVQATGCCSPVGQVFIALTPGR
jgi:hypothetical protein